MCEYFQILRRDILSFFTLNLQTKDLEQILLLYPREAHYFPLAAHPMMREYFQIVPRNSLTRSTIVRPGIFRDGAIPSYITISLFWNSLILRL